MNPVNTLNDTLELLGGQKIEAEPDMPNMVELVCRLLAENDDLRRRLEATCD